MTENLQFNWPDDFPEEMEEARFVPRQLTDGEIEALEKNGNWAQNWETLWVAPEFNPARIHHCEFRGRVALGAFGKLPVAFPGKLLPSGLYYCCIEDSLILDGAALRHVDYVKNYVVGPGAGLFRVGEVCWTGDMDFYNHITLECWNENGGRQVLGRPLMSPAEAWWQARFPQKPLERSEPRLSPYGVLGRNISVAHTPVLRDVYLDEGTVVEGAARIERCAILSRKEKPTYLGSNVDLCDGIIHYDCRVIQGVKARHFILGNQVTLTQGARLTHTYVGDVSTIGCCEVANSLLFPFHEQHHNNSFLIAGLLEGQSNVAAGATIGSNHNSRANDGEIVAKRGFWPGLSTSFKHNSRFASFCLPATGQYPRELDIPFPFALISRDPSEKALTILPAFWFLYNMYALLRNAWKFQNRDHRPYPCLSEEREALAPDTAEEIFHALDLLESATGRALCKEQGLGALEREEDYRKKGRDVLEKDPELAQSLPIILSGVEKGAPPARLFKVAPAWATYRRMLFDYGMRQTLFFMNDTGQWDLEEAVQAMPECYRDWINVGGLPVPRAELDRVERAEELGEALEDWQGQYPDWKSAHGWDCLLRLEGLKKPPRVKQWRQWLERFLRERQWIAEQARESRRKDFDNPFRGMVYLDQKEQEAVLGNWEDNPFLEKLAEETATWQEAVGIALEESRNG